MVTVGNLIVQVRNRKEWKEFWKIAGIRILGIAIPVIGIVLYIMLQGAFSDFMNYCFWGIRTFSNSISYSTLFKAKGIIKFLSISIPIVFGLLLIYYIRNRWKQKKNTTNNKKDVVPFLLFAYGIAEFSVVFPISDKIHFLIGSTIGIIGMFYIVIEITKKAISLIAKKIAERNRNWIEKYITYFTEMAIILFLIFLLGKNGNQVIQYAITANQYQQLEHYHYIPITEGLLDRVENVNSWITSQEKDVYILDSEAVLYQIALNRYHKDYDMFLKGNLGGKGEEGQIEKLQKENNSIVLVRKDNYSRNWQNPEMVRKFILENYEKIDSVDIFDGYDLSRKRSKDG